jgi:PncC family amidohydrolase
VVKPEELLGTLLREKGLKIALAESCTGGLIASRITDIPGASEYFEAGVVVYSNRAKQRFLSVPEQSIRAHGAVSKEVAEKMAEGVRQATGTDIGLSITGVAGPGGGSPEKPVGTVYIGLSAKERTLVRRFQFSGDRLDIKEKSAVEAFRLAIDFLEGRAA